MIFRLLFFATLFLSFQACSQAPDGGKNQAATNAVDLASAEKPKSDTIDLHGTIETPKGISPLGIIVFAEGTSMLAVAGNNGEFLISSVPAGQYNLFAVRGDLNPTLVSDVLITQAILDSEVDRFEVESVMIENFTSQNNLAVSALSGAGVVKGFVAAPRRADLMGVLVEVAGTDIRTSTDTEGQYTLVNVPAGELTLRFSRSGYSPELRSINVVSTQETNVPIVNLRLRTPGATGGKTIYGEVVLLDINANPIRDFSETYITLSDSPTRGGYGERTYTDERGIFEISGLEAKSYVVFANTKGFVLGQPVTVNLANTDVAQVTLLLNQDPSAADLTGIIIGQVLLEDSPKQGSAGVSISLTGSSIRTTTDNVGTFTLEGVEPGTYTLVAEFNGYETAFLENINMEPSGLVSLEPITLKKEVEYPKVVSTNPADGAVDVTIDDPTIVTIVFDQPMNVSSVRSALTISPTVSYSIEGRTSQSDRIQIAIAGFSKSATPLKFGTTYTITLGTAAQSAKGIGLEEEYQFSFKTGEAKVTASFPSDGDRGVFITKFEPIRIYFNAPLDLKSLESSDLRFRPNLPASADVYLQNDSKTGWGILTIGADLLFDEEYELTIPNRIRTITNDRITNLPYRIRFTTTSRTEASFPQNNRESEREQILQEKKRK